MLFPATRLCDTLDDTPETLVLDVPQTEGERVLPRQRGELILARPLQQHRAARALRQDRRLEGGVGVAVAAIGAARDLGKDADFFLGQADCLRDLLAYAERAVRADIHRCSVGADVRDRGARSDRRVGDRREHVGLRETHRGAAKALIHLRIRAHRHLGGRAVNRQSVPVGVDRPRRGASLLVALGNDAYDVALPNDSDHSRHLPCGGVIDRAELRAASRWTHHRAAGHAGQAHVGDEGGSSGHDVARLDVRRRLPSVSPPRSRHERDAIGNDAGQGLGIEKLAVRHALAAADYGARLGVELFAGDAELRARAIEELTPRERGRLAQEWRFLGDRLAAERAEVERHLVGVSEHHIHALDWHVELVGDDLCESRAEPLSEVDLSRQRGDRSVAFDADPLLQPFWLATVPHQDDPATRRIARIARPYTPQRQRLPASASRIEVSSGRGSCARSATAEMTIPLVQYPHWSASPSMNACCTGWSFVPSPSPSTVVISMRAA